MWQSSTLLGFLGNCLPVELGGKLHDSPTGQLVTLPGLPAMYDWEFVPQELPGMGDVAIEIESYFQKSVSLPLMTTNEYAY